MRQIDIYRMVGIGRRWAIAICVALFSLFTAAAGLFRDPVLFGLARFTAGIGIGGIMPNAIAQKTDYAPRRVRSTMVTLMFSGYSVGGMLAALLGKSLIESYGWQSVFIAVGSPILLIPLILKSMPESVSFLVRRGRSEDLKRLAASIAPTYRADANDLFAFVDASAAPISRLFRQGRAGPGWSMCSNTP